MPNQIKIDTVTDLADKLGRSKSVVLTDYRGLSVAQISDLRKQVEAAGARFEVTKNTLLSRALGEKKAPTEALEGPTATLLSFEDEITPLKVLQDFIKANNLPTIKVGFLGQTLLSAQEVIQLSKLPGREILLGKLVGALKGNQFALVNVLSGNFRKLVYVLDAVAKVKS